MKDAAGRAILTMNPYAGDGHLYQRFVKRALDAALSALALLFLSPLLLVIALWVKLDSKGPVFFRQKRVGIRKTHFEIYKFRTMYTDAPKTCPPIFWAGRTPASRAAGAFCAGCR